MTEELKIGEAPAAETAAEATPTPETAAAASPETASPDEQQMLAGKFKTPAELEKAYKELEKKLGGGATQPPPSVEAVLERAGLRGDELAANYLNDGRLTDSQYESLAKVGYTRDVVDQFLAGQASIASSRVDVAKQAVERAIEQVGGTQQWSNLAEWARTHYPPDKIKELDTRLDDPRTTESAVKEMLYDYRIVAGRGVSQPMLHGAAPPASTEAFSTVEEVIEAMSRIGRQGYIDETTKRRIAASPKHLFQGITR
jgi:hypothetical protein